MLSSFFYMGQITEQNRKTQLLRQIIRNLKRVGIPVLLYFVPTDIQSGVQYQGERCRYQIRRNVSFLEEVIRQEGASSYNFSESLGADYFVWRMTGDCVDEHLNEAGRDFVANELSKKIHFASNEKIGVVLPMSFNSIQFLFFFPVVVGLYFVLPHRLRSVMLLLASYAFYMAWRPKFVLIIIALTFIDYFAGILIGLAKTKRRRLLALLLSLSANLGILFFFKYFNFFNDSLRGVFGYFSAPYPIHPMDIILPLGISFHTFQTMAYTIEVYMGKHKPEKSLLNFALYVAYFPQLVAGPIERPGNLLPQFRQKFSFDYDRVTSGLKLMLWGMFKKVVIADNLSIFVNRVYNHPGDYEGISLVMATIFFAFQIYCDFSGYTDIAIGAAEVMGIRLMKNFDRPYFSKSIAEFWRRWHISLSSWFRDYLYIPLGGNRVSTSRRSINLFIVFLLSGPLARGQLDVHHLGSAPWVLYSLWNDNFALARRIEPGDQPQSPSLAIENAPGCLYLLSRLLCMDLLPRQQYP